MEPTYAQLIALFAAWRQDIDSEPFAYEGEWTAMDGRLRGTKIGLRRDREV